MVKLNLYPETYTPPNFDGVINDIVTNYGQSPYLKEPLKADEMVCRILGLRDQHGVIYSGVLCKNFYEYRYIKEHLLKQNFITDAICEGETYGSLGFHDIYYLDGILVDAAQRQVMDRMVCPMTPILKTENEFIYPGYKHNRHSFSELQDLLQQDYTMDIRIIPRPHYDYNIFALTAHVRSSLPHIHQWTDVLMMSEDNLPLEFPTAHEAVVWVSHHFPDTPLYPR